MTSKTKRQQRRERNRRQKLTSNLIWAGVGVIVFAIIGYMVWRGVRPAMGEPVPIMVSAPHIAEDTDPGSYNSDPPTSGLHYAQVAQAGFYDTNNYSYPAGYLVHNLEHGYVIFWYNCSILTENDCSELKDNIKAVMEELGREKMIAYPSQSIDVPLVMTSWGQLEKFETFEIDKVKAFYRTNLNRSPEPNAQ